MAFGFGKARGKGDILHSPLEDYHIGTLKVGATATDVRTGRLVARSAAGKVQAGADKSNTVVGVCRARVRKDSDKDSNRTFDRDADFATDDWIEVVKPKPGAKVELLLLDGEVVVFGDKLRAAASGKVKKASVVNVTIPSGAVAVTSTAANGDILTETGSLAPDGEPVAVALEDLSPSGADGWILAQWGGQ